MGQYSKHPPLIAMVTKWTVCAFLRVCVYLYVYHCGDQVDLNVITGLNGTAGVQTPALFRPTLLFNYSQLPYLYRIVKLFCKCLKAKVRRPHEHKLFTLLVFKIFLCKAPLMEVMGTKSTVPVLCSVFSHLSEANLRLQQS